MLTRAQFVLLQNLQTDSKMSAVENINKTQCITLTDFVGAFKVALKSHFQNVILVKAEY